LPAGFFIDALLKRAHVNWLNHPDHSQSA